MDELQFMLYMYTYSILLACAKVGLRLVKELHLLLSLRVTERRRKILGLLHALKVGGKS